MKKYNDISKEILITVREKISSNSEIHLELDKVLKERVQMRSNFIDSLLDNTVSNSKTRDIADSLSKLMAEHGFVFKIGQTSYSDFGDDDWSESHIELDWDSNAVEIAMSKSLKEERVNEKMVREAAEELGIHNDHNLSMASLKLLEFSDVSSVLSNLWRKFESWGKYAFRLDFEEGNNCLWFDNESNQMSYSSSISKLPKTFLEDWDVEIITPWEAAALLSTLDYMNYLLDSGLATLRGEKPDVINVYVDEELLKKNVHTSKANAILQLIFSHLSTELKDIGTRGGSNSLSNQNSNVVNNFAHGEDNHALFDDISIDINRINSMELEPEIAITLLRYKNDDDFYFQNEKPRIYNKYQVAVDESYANQIVSITKVDGTITLKRDKIA